MKPTKEQIDEEVSWARKRWDRGTAIEGDAVITALADQRAELVALLKDCARHIVWADDVVNTDYNKSEKSREVDAEKFLDASEALLARIGVTP